MSTLGQIEKREIKHRNRQRTGVRQNQILLALKRAEAGRYKDATADSLSGILMRPDQAAAALRSLARRDLVIRTTGSSLMPISTCTTRWKLSEAGQEKVRWLNQQLPEDADLRQEAVA